MSRFCTRCGEPLPPSVKFCTKCGAAAAVEPAPAKNEEIKAVPAAAPEKKKPKKENKLRGLIVALCIVLGVAGVIAFSVFAFGNFLTLKPHTEKVCAHINSGNLDLSSLSTDPYEDIPLYVKEMMGETADPSELGPIVSAMAPYIEIECVKVDGFFGKSCAEYRIRSRDLGGFILSFDRSSVSSSEELLSKILEYLPSAPEREFTVTVEYRRDGLFSWKGNYETPEFADAISGGLNSAYNTLYEEMLKEMEELLG